LELKGDTPVVLEQFAETFFKSLKQTSGRSKPSWEPAKRQFSPRFWTALIVMLLLRWLKLKASYGWSLSNLLALLRQQLFVYRDLFQWLDNPFTRPPDLVGGAQQLVLDLP
jgi:hypothetical protein